MIYESEKSMILLPRLMHAVRLLESMVHAKSIWTTLPLQLVKNLVLTILTIFSLLNRARRWYSSNPQ